MVLGFAGLFAIVGFPEFFEKGGTQSVFANNEMNRHGVRLLLQRRQTEMSIAVLTIVVIAGIAALLIFAITHNGFQ